MLYNDKIILVLISLFICSYSQKSPCGSPSIKPSIKSKKQNRIIGGNEAKPNSWPWIVSIRFSNGTSKNHICGGSLIHSQYVITAANCVHGKNISLLSVVVGCHSLDEALDLKNNFNVSKIFIHPNFEIEKIEYNIAVLKLEKYLNTTRKISTICLPPDNDETFVYRKNVVIAGWGSTNGFNNRESVSKELHQIQLKVFTNETLCKKYNQKTYCLRDNTKKMSNICYGDGGSPMMITRKNAIWYLYGVASFTSVDKNAFTCINREPSYFTIVARFIQWINTTIEINGNKKFPKFL